MMLYVFDQMGNIKCYTTEPQFMEWNTWEIVLLSLFASYKLLIFLAQFHHEHLKKQSNVIVRKPIQTPGLYG